MRELIPISLVSEYVFCARSAWLAYVAGIFEPNEFTVEGEILHRRVHSKGSGKRTGKRQWRKVPVYSRRLGVVGYADLVEEIEGQFFPVEYKRGKARLRLSDQVQLCLQGMCLEEMLHCPIETGYIYYASSRRRLEVDLTGPLRRLTRKAIHEVRELVQQDKPPPAILSPKCRGCAQRSACMPDMPNVERFSWEEWLA
jgi:CRISPR-associated exonuclease Cas4